MALAHEDRDRYYRHAVGAASDTLVLLARRVLEKVSNRRDRIGGLARISTLSYDVAQNVAKRRAELRFLLVDRAAGGGICSKPVVVQGLGLEIFASRDVARMSKFAREVSTEALSALVELLESSNK